MDKIKSMIKSYLGWPTNIVNNDLLPLLRKQNVQFKTKYPFKYIGGQLYANNYSVLLGYVLDKDKNIIYFYFGYPKQTFDYIKFNYGYMGFKQLLDNHNSIIKNCYDQFNYIENSAELVMIDPTTDKKMIKEKKK